MLPASPRESEKGREARQQAATVAGTLDAADPEDRDRGAARGYRRLARREARSPPATPARGKLGRPRRAHAASCAPQSGPCATINVTVPRGGRSAHPYPIARRGDHVLAQRPCHTSADGERPSVPWPLRGVAGVARAAGERRAAARRARGARWREEPLARPRGGRRGREPESSPSASGEIFPR